MSLSSIDAAGLAGIQAGSDRVNRAARGIAGGTRPGADLSGPLVDLSVGKVQVEASVAVVRTGTEMLGSLIDIHV